VVYDVTVVNDGTVFLDGIAVASSALNVSCAGPSSTTALQVGDQLHCTAVYTVSTADLQHGFLNHTLLMRSGGLDSNGTSAYDTTVQLASVAAFSPPSLSAVIDPASCDIPTHSGKISCRPCCLHKVGD